MKTDFEILITLLILTRALTSLKYTKRHTILKSQLSALIGDMNRAYQLAYYKVQQYHEHEDPTGLGKKFIHFYTTFVALGYRISTISEEDDLLSIMKDSEEFWSNASITLHSGFNKNGGLATLEKKRKLCYLGLSMVMAVGHTPTIVPKKAQAVLHQLLERVFEYAEEIPYNRTSIMTDLEHLRYGAICSIYRLLELVKQVTTLTREGPGRKAPHRNHVECYSNLPDPEEVSAMGNMTDVLWVRAALESDCYKGFEKAYRKYTDKKT